MVEKKYIINIEQGLHMRPAGVITNTMMKFDCDVNLVLNGNKVNAKSIMNIMASCIKKGTEIIVECDGPQEQEALDKFQELYESGFGDI